MAAWRSAPVKDHGSRRLASINVREARRPSATLRTRRHWGAQERTGADGGHWGGGERRPRSDGPTRFAPPSARKSEETCAQSVPGLNSCPWPRSSGIEQQPAELKVP